MREITIYTSKIIKKLSLYAALFAWVFALLLVWGSMEQRELLPIAVLLIIGALAFSAVAVSMRLYQVKLQGRYGTYTNFWGRKKEISLSSVAEVQISLKHGAVAMDREQNKIFSVPANADNYLNYLLYLKREDICLTYTGDGTFSEEIMSEIQSDDPELESYFREGFPQYLEEQESSEAKKLRRVRNIIIFISATLVLLMFAVASRTENSLLKDMQVPVFLASVALLGLINTFVEHKTRKKIMQEGTMQKGKIVEFTERSGGKVFPFVEFSDERGLHCVKSGDAVRIPKKEEASWINREVSLLYHPGWPSQIMLMEEGLEGRSISVKRTGEVVFSAVFMLLAVFSLWFYIGQNNTPEKRQGDRLRVAFAEDYEASAFEQEDVDSDTVQWICAAYANYTEFNNKDLGTVGGATKDHDYWRDSIATALEDGWGIKDRESAVSGVYNLLDKGHRSAYREFVEEMKKKGMMDLSEEQLIKQVEEQDDGFRYVAAYRAYHEFGDKGIDGWDYSRALQILGDCYQVGYISLEECLDQSLPIARELQKEFNSFDELGKSYLYGYQYWKKDDADESYSDSGQRKKIHEELMAMEDGPYMIPYDTELKSSWSDVKTTKKEEKQAEEKAMKGYKKVSCMDKTQDGSAVIKIPEGFEYEDYSSETVLCFSGMPEDSALVTYMLYYYGGASEDYINQLNEQTAAFYGKEQVEVGACQTVEVNGQTISYAWYSYMENGVKKKECSGYMELEGGYTLSCKISETAQEGEDIRLLKDEAKALEKMFEDIEI